MQSRDKASNQLKMNQISRRQALKQTLFFAATMALGTSGRRLRAREIPSGDLHFLMIGDWGPAPSSTVQFKAQQAVASGMKQYVESMKLRPEGLFLLGDNFYGEFKGGVNSPRWKINFEDMYPSETFPGPCWAMLGNHDYSEEVGVKMEAELAYASACPNTRWTMPAKYYRFEWPKKNPLVSCLVLDSNYPNNNHSMTDAEREEQLVWLKTELAKPRVAPWLVCMAHHPLYSNGIHGDQPKLIEDWSPIFEKHKVDFYFCGHDHDLQHLEFENTRTSYVVSGGGGARVYELKRTERGPFAKQAYGFTHLQVNNETFTVRHIDANQKQLHAFTKQPNGKIKVIS